MDPGRPPSPGLAPARLILASGVPTARGTADRTKGGVGRPCQAETGAECPSPTGQAGWRKGVPVF
jgi:hypothetical protein